MLADLLPIFALAIALVALPSLGLRAMRQRQAYCGKSPRQCFWCKRHCEYYGFDEPTPLK